MITGNVNAYKVAIVPLELRRPDGSAENVSAAVDTGYNGFLTVTPEIAARLQMPFRESRSYELGDGGIVNFPVHDATIHWDGQDVTVATLVTDGGILIGMSLLAGYTLFVDAVDGGEVRIEPRP